MTITTESIERKKQKAFNAGRDFALGKRDESNLHESHFSEITSDEWLMGYESIDPPKEAPASHTSYFTSP